jgi:hypothetical protein
MMISSTPSTPSTAPQTPQQYIPTHNMSSTPSSNTRAQHKLLGTPPFEELKPKSSGKQRVSFGQRQKEKTNGALIQEELNTFKKCYQP